MTSHCIHKEIYVSKSVSARMSIAGILLGLLGILIGSAHFFLGPIEPAPTIESFVEEKTKSIRDAITSGLKGGSKYADDVQPRFSRDQMVDTGVVAIGVFALGLGIFGFIREEPLRAAGAAGLLGVATIIMPFAIAIVGAIIAVIIIAAIIDAVGLG